MATGYDKVPVLECLTCEEKYSEQDIAENKFFPRTCICFKCYRNLQKAPISIACFGKRGKELGYNPLAVECRLLCPDRTICPHFVNGEIPMKHEMSEKDRKAALALLFKSDKKQKPRAHPFREGTLIHEGFELCRKGTTRAKLDKLCKVWASNQTSSRLLRWYRREQLHGCTWTIVEEGSSIRISFTENRNVELQKRKK
jgi:hypothetical protein